MRQTIYILFLMAVNAPYSRAAAPDIPCAGPSNGIVEFTVHSRKQYSDGFNEVDLDVVFERDGLRWRVPAFWRGGSRWTVRFAPPSGGTYQFHLESTDPTNPDLNGHPGCVTVKPYSGPMRPLERGMIRVAPDKRHFEYQDGTPFFWLGDTWWAGLSSRLSWQGFNELARDREAKGFTLVQTVAGLVPTEELSPVDPGSANEGGQVWTPGFGRINPRYFDYADRRIQSLLNHDLVPAIVGGWNLVLGQMGVEKMERQWRYLIARYGAYPVIWIVGGEVMDPPAEIARDYPPEDKALLEPGWTQVARYIRDHDPYHHPLTVHENFPPYDTALRAQDITDFDLLQSSHFGWASIAVEVAQLNQRYSRTTLKKPVVEGEIGYEALAGTHLQDFQRTAFWLAMLNGAAGFTYGANGVWESYTPEAPLHRLQWSFMTWREGMKLPGSYEVGLAGKFLRGFDWWEFAPHPEWVSPRGTTLLELHTREMGFAYGSPEPCSNCPPGDRIRSLEASYAAQEWKDKGGTFRLPYAAGIPRKVRLVYVPAVGLFKPEAPTVLGLETGIRYHAFWWEPSTGTRLDLGSVQVPAREDPVLSVDFAGIPGDDWQVLHASPDGKDNANGMKGDATMGVRHDIKARDVVVEVRSKDAGETSLLLRFENGDNYVAAVLSRSGHCLYIFERRGGKNGLHLGETRIDSLLPMATLRVEVRGALAAAEVSDDEHTYRTPIVDVERTEPGTVGIVEGVRGMKNPTHISVWRSPAIAPQEKSLDRRLIDARGVFRGELSGPDLAISSFKSPGWSRFGHDEDILLDSFRPDRLPTPGDWVLALLATPAQP